MEILMPAAAILTVVVLGAVLAKLPDDPTESRTRRPGEQ